MSGPVSGAGISPVALVSRAANKLDVFTVGTDGGIYTAAWESGDGEWRGWWRVGELEVAPCAPVSAVVRATNKIDLFAVGLDGQVYTAAWEQGDEHWRGWWRIGDLRTTLHARVCALSRSANTLDLFVADDEGSVQTAAWEPTGAEWRGWWSVADLRVPPGAPLGGCSRAANKLDIFVVGEGGQVFTAAWAPEDPQWRGWWQVGSLATVPGTAVTAVARSTDKLDLFTCGSDGRVYTAAWEPGDTDWRGWWSIDGLAVTARTRVEVVCRSADKIDIFVTGDDPRVFTAGWDPGAGWGAWTAVDYFIGSGVGVVSRSKGVLDVVACSNLDHRVHAAARTPDDSAWRGWWGIGDLTTGMTDPRVGEWTKAGTAFSLENTASSNEAQGMTTDGASWFLVSNGSKTLRRYDNGANLQNAVKVSPGAHIGAPGFAGGWIYVPTQGPHGVWRARTDLTGGQFTAADGGANRFAWCDVNPLNGRLYTCEYDIWNNAHGVLFAYDRSTLQRRPEDDIALGATPIHFDRLQGGVFTRRGRVLLNRSGPNAIFCFSTLTGICLGAKHLGDFGSAGSELEGVTVREWSFGAKAATVHVLELDNDAISDDCYLHSFSVPEPERL